MQSDKGDSYENLKLEAQVTFCIIVFDFKVTPSGKQSKIVENPSCKKIYTLKRILYLLIYDENIRLCMCSKKKFNLYPELDLNI